MNQYSFETSQPQFLNGVYTTDTAAGRRLFNSELLLMKGALSNRSFPAHYYNRVNARLFCREKGCLAVKHFSRCFYTTSSY